MTPSANIIQQLEQCIEKLRDNQLTEEPLHAIIRQIGAQGTGHQDLLYLQAQNSGVTASILGISLVQNGTVMDLPDNPDEWPYKTVAQAIQDGWRIIQFPNLMLDDDRTYSLGCEFILEKWSP
jgi:hypothetical protein